MTGDLAFIEGWFAAQAGRSVTAHGLLPDGVNVTTEQFFCAREPGSDELRIGFDTAEGTSVRSFTDRVTASARGGTLYVIDGEHAFVFAPTRGES